MSLAAAGWQVPAPVGAFVPGEPSQELWGCRRGPGGRSLRSPGSACRRSSRNAGMLLTRAGWQLVLCGGYSIQALVEVTAFLCTFVYQPVLQHQYRYAQDASFSVFWSQLVLIFSFEMVRCCYQCSCLSLAVRNHMAFGFIALVRGVSNLPGVTAAVLVTSASRTSAAGGLQRGGLQVAIVLPGS